MKKISLLAIALVFIGTLSQADQKNEAAKEVIESPKQGNFSNLLDLKTEPMMTQGAGDGICPVLGYKVYNKTLVRIYPPTSVDPDCPPH